MEQKTDAVRREILKSLIERYAVKGKKALISKVKENGVYKNFVSDEEVYMQIEKFAEFHNLNLNFSKTVIEDTIIPEPKKKEVSEEDYFLSILKQQHNLLSKKMLYLNKLISTYEIDENN